MRLGKELDRVHCQRIDEPCLLTGMLIEGTDVRVTEHNKGRVAFGRSANGARLQNLTAISRSQHVAL